MTGPAVGRGPAARVEADIRTEETDRHPAAAALPAPGVVLLSVVIPNIPIFVAHPAILPTYSTTGI